MKQAILDYVLSNPLERQRLGLEGLQPLLVPRAPDAAPTADAVISAGVLGRSLAPASHAALVQRQLPPEWHEHVAMARYGTYTHNATAAVLNGRFCATLAPELVCGPSEMTHSDVMIQHKCCDDGSNCATPCCCVCVNREDIVWTLQTLNPNALELNRLWHEHGYASAVRLLDVSSPDMLERLPVKVRAFAVGKTPKAGIPAGK